MEPRAKTFIERLGFVDPDRRKAKHDEMQIWVYKNFRTIVKEVFPGIKIEQYEPLKLSLEYPIADQNSSRNFIVGFIDVYCRQIGVGIEVKTEILSIGDLIRQVQFYRKYVSGSWIIVSADDRNSEILYEQGISFFKYPEASSQLSLQLCISS